MDASRDGWRQSSEPALKDDKTDRQRYYEQALKTGLAQSGSRSTSGRSSPGLQ